MKTWLKEKGGSIAAKQAKRKIAFVAIGMLLAGVSVEAMAASATAGSSLFAFPLIDDILCGFWSYSRSRMAPLIAGIVVVIAMIGHWLGVSKVWGTLLYVGLGLGLILGIGTIIASYTGVGTSCLTT